MLKYAKKIVLFALAALLLVGSFAACNNDPASTSTDNAQLGPKLSDDYVVIYEEGLDKAVNNIRSALKTICGKTVPALKASEATGEYAHAVLLGNTGRIESTEFIEALKENEYGVKIIETDSTTTIVVAAKTSDIIGYAADLFSSEYLPTEKGATNLLKKETTVKTCYASPEDNKAKNVYGGIVFEEEIITVTRTVSGVPYTRMTKLKDGRLMMVYGKSNQIVAIYSSDKGKTWTNPVNVTNNALEQDDRDGKNLLLANAMAYQLEDGTILVAYRANEAVNRSDGPDSIKKTGKYHSSIRIMGSTDNGKTFQRHSIVWDLYEENIQDWYASCGLWEPHLGMLNGELACFFAIGKSVYEYNHPINSTDIFVYRNNEWVRAEYSSNETPGAVAGSSNAIKNGMPVWQELIDGNGYVMAVESNQNRHGKYSNVLTAKLFTSVDGKYWESQCDVYIPKKTKTKSGAPYVVQLPTGQVVVSYMTDDDIGQSDADKGCIFKFSVSKPGLSVFELTGESDFEGPFNVFNLPKGSTAVYGGMYIDDEYLYMYTATDNNGNKIILRRAPLSQFKTN